MELSQLKITYFDEIFPANLQKGEVMDVHINKLSSVEKTDLSYTMIVHKMFRRSRESPPNKRNKTVHFMKLTRID